MLKVDFHVHTKYSADSKSEISEVLQFAKRRGLDAIAITDHDNLQGNIEARRIRKSSDVKIIPGIELTLPAGKWGFHIIALNIDQYISFSSITEAFKKLKELKATLILPHPFRGGTGFFDHVKEGTISKKEQDLILENIDYVEILNMKDVRGAVKKTFEWARKHGYPVVSGTDSHYPEFIGMTYTEVSGLSAFLKGKSKTNKVVAFCRKKPKNFGEVVNYLETAADFRYKFGKTATARLSARILYKLGLIHDHTDRRLRAQFINTIFRDSNKSSIKKDKTGLKIG